MSKEHIFSDADQCTSRRIHQDRIDRARQASLDEEDYVRLAQLFKAMGDPTRLRILYALEKGEMCVCDLAVYLGLTESAVSHQLRLLRQLHLVANRRHGPVLYYRLDDDHVSQLIGLARQHLDE